MERKCWGFSSWMAFIGRRMVIDNRSLGTGTECRSPSCFSNEVPFGFPKSETGFVAAGGCVFHSALFETVPQNAHLVRSIIISVRGVSAFCFWPARSPALHGLHHRDEADGE